MGKRYSPRLRVERSVRNQSSRHGDIEAIVLHSSEAKDVPGLGDLIGMGNWFDNPASDASAHAAVDREGYSARYVPDDRKAWSCAAYNSPTLNLELVAYARFALAAWLGRGEQLEEAARWLVLWSDRHHVPLQRGQAAGGRITRPGVLMHMELGQIGGGHHDPGRPFPIGRLLRKARKLQREKHAHK